ncbi:FprA family A-type flavoprotein [Fervidicoccus fontis]|uniref:FprA family A-type flavoprotein n=1 Tax=Fervidicoccus fontis TaxID=683846 RepID=A0A843AC44_9CREN|nr:FprA family A-type flavoprotein [Fervidicoccus fontis]
MNEKILVVNLLNFKPIKLTEGIYWVGVKDWSRKIFDAFAPLERGTSYNSYLVKGSTSVALIDTVESDFQSEFFEKLESVVNIKDIKYVIMNHAEPDHSGSIPVVMEKASDAKLVTTAFGAKLAKVFYHVPDERIKIVRDGDIIDLGGRTLKFIEAPMLHWPETMFTYLVEDGVLFSCDFFSAHLAEGIWDDDVSDIIEFSKEYWATIMMPFRTNAISALKKISNLKIKMIAPSHGPIIRHPEKILEKYNEWAEGKTDKKVLILYVSMYKHTESIARLLESEFFNRGINVKLYDLVQANLSEVSKNMADSSAIVLAVPTIIGSIHPIPFNYLYLLKLLKPPIKYAGVIITFGWGTSADKQIEELLKDSKIEILDTIKVNVNLSEDNKKQIFSLVEKIEAKLRT